MRTVEALKRLSDLRHLNRNVKIYRYIPLFSLLTFCLVIAAIRFGELRWIGRAATAGVISGAVFQDYNANGARDLTRTVKNAGEGSAGVAVDRGIAGVTVTAYASGGAVAGSATTNDQGDYSINAAGSGPYRIEFANLPAGFKSGPFGADSKSTVQFVDGASASNVSLGLVIPAEFCQDNPTMVTTCYVAGNQSQPLPAVISFSNSYGSSRETGGAPFTDFDDPHPNLLAAVNQVGTTWGIAYARSAKQLYAAAFMKKHSGFGTAGTGAIYKIDGNNPGAISLYTDLNSIYGAGTTGVDPHDPNDFDRDNGNATWAAVGKIAFGQMAISGDEEKLYVMSLADRSVYEIPLDATPSASTIRRRSAPLNPPGCANQGDVRPFALVWEKGKLYAGMVCTAESTITQSAPDGDASQLRAYVYTVDPATLDFSASPVFQMALNYPRRCADSAQNGIDNCFRATWRPWSAVYRNIGAEARGIYPQPWLTDIAFDNGNLILGFRDRAGDQFGNEILDNPADNLRYYGVTAGDLIRACGSESTGWTLESNGRCGGRGVGPQNNSQGPGGGEYYFRDDTQPFTDEITMGGMIQIPGFSTLAVNGFDTIPIFTLDTLFDGGTRWFDNATGASVKNYRIYNGDRFPLTLFGKANGLGDLVALCDEAPIEIGNRIWEDKNGNGVQDAGEPPIATVTVGLFKNGVQVGTATTNGQGEFYFNSSNVTGGVLPNMAYEIRVDKSQARLNGYALTGAEADSSPNGESRDSDAVTSGSNAVIALTTGGAGEVNHTFDIGFTPPGGPVPAISCPTDIVFRSDNPLGAIIHYPQPVVSDPSATVACTPPSGSIFGPGKTTVTCTATNSAGSASCSFTVHVISPPDIVCTSDITVISSDPAQVFYVDALTSTPGATVTCAPPSGSIFPVGKTTVTCTATNADNTASASCSFKVSVSQMMIMKKGICKTICMRSPAYYAFNIDHLPRGFVLISGVNNNSPVSTADKFTILSALRPNSPVLSARQRFNQEFVATQLSLNAYGGATGASGSTAMWGMLSCYGIDFAPVTLGNGETISQNSMLNDLFQQAYAAIRENRVDDLAKLATLLDMFNGNSVWGECGR